MLLVTDSAIELAPTTTQSGYMFCDSVKKHYIPLNAILGVLRLNSQINKEASDIFYGENDFRFSSDQGWYYMFGFLRTIGSENISRLRSLNVCVPWKGEEGVKDTYATHDDFERKVHGIIMKGMGIRLGQTSLDTFERTVKSSLSLLKANPGLKQMRLILPSTYVFETIPVDPTTLTRTLGLWDVGITLIHVREDDHSYVHGLGRAQIPLRVAKKHGAMRTTYADPKAFADAQGWRYAEAIYGNNGTYGVRPV